MSWVGAGPPLAAPLRAREGVQRRSQTSTRTYEHLCRAPPDPSCKHRRRREFALDKQETAVALCVLAGDAVRTNVRWPGL
eukprot:2438782-Pyramimonas_sp.AAC.1